MAKSEQVAKKTKGKKRKHTDAQSEDESVVAAKSLILERQDDDEATTKTKDLKRKSSTNSRIKKKRSKRGDSSDEADVADEELHEPSLAELLESEKPENTSAIVTVRQKKKRKHQERQAAEKDNTGDKEGQRNAEYLRKWKRVRSEWKFEKLRQISVQQTVFDEEKIKADVWPIALEYLSGSKGAAKNIITKLAENVIDELDKKCADCESDEGKAIINSVKYQRARDLLQSFA